MSMTPEEWKKVRDLRERGCVRICDSVGKHIPTLALFNFYTKKSRTSAENVETKEGTKRVWFPQFYHNAENTEWIQGLHYCSDRQHPIITRKNASGKWLDLDDDIRKMPVVVFGRFEERGDDVYVGEFKLLNDGDTRHETFIRIAESTNLPPPDDHLEANLQR